MTDDSKKVDRTDNSLKNTHSNINRSRFELIEEPSWRRGLTTLVIAEMRTIYKNKKWLTQLIFMVLLINGMILLVTVARPFNDTGEDLMGLFLTSMTLWTAISIIIVMQGAIIDEKISGTAEWILSKPVSRNAFILSKIANNTLALTLFLFLIPGTIGIVQIKLMTNASIEIWQLYLVLAVCWLHGLFYFSLSIMLGTLVNNRRIAMAIPLAYLIGQDFIGFFVYNLPTDYFIRSLCFSGEKMSLASSIISNAPIESWTPFVLATFVSILFLEIAIWRFNKYELNT